MIGQTYSGILINKVTVDSQEQRWPLSTRPVSVSFARNGTLSGSLLFTETGGPKPAYSSEKRSLMSRKQRCAANFHPTGMNAVAPEILLLAVGCKAERRA